ncbi:MAG TPA: EamA family transporter [Bryobacteraceae bacterium]|nr:EamA family transporter [Bryobacteraceae bacterium]
MREHPDFRAWVALFAVYFFWGTTYLAIRMALESFPPLVMISLRFLLSGVVLVIAAVLLRAHLPRGRELWMTAFYGVMALGGGNGTLVFAEQWIPSGLAALFITTGPFWMVGVEHLLPGGKRLHIPMLAGIAVGFTGVLMLVAPAAFGSGFQASLLKGFLVLQLGSVCWTTGSLLQRRHPARAHPIVSGAIQQVATGLAFVAPAALIDERAVEWNPRGVAALVYLVVFGSIVGYSAYVYALNKLPVAVVSTYTYVNPVVAVFLGWVFYREPFGMREAVAMMMIFAGVALVKYWTKPV